MEKITYYDRLRLSAHKAGNIVCFGYDPVVASFHLNIASMGIGGAKPHMYAILNEMGKRNVYPASWKPNLGFYLKYGSRGIKVMEEVIDVWKTEVPWIPIILDPKNGDIGKSSMNYGEAAFETFGTDAITIHPGMGHDSVSPFAELGIKHGCGGYNLIKTSNPGSDDFMNLHNKETGELNYLITLKKTIEWAEKYPEFFGMVVSAKHTKDMENIAKFLSLKGINLPWLIPGVGGQKGDPVEVMRILKHYGMELPLVRINSSSGLSHPWGTKPAPDNYPVLCVDVLEKTIELTGKIAA